MHCPNNLCCYKRYFNKLIMNPIVASELRAFTCNWINLISSIFNLIVTLMFNFKEAIMLIKIGELAKRTGATVETIRYYEKEGLLPEPSRSAGNYRLYNEEHIERLQFILHCRTLDMAMDEVRVLLQYWNEPERDCDDVDALLDEHIEAVKIRIKELMQLKQHLTFLRQKCTSSAPAVSCGILNALADNSCHE